MQIDEIRQKYLNFFSEREHEVIPSAPLVPENDPTTLFTGSGMQPLLPYLLGQPHPKGKRLADSQKCFRAEDIDEVGDNRHTTFFEMLGNWSLGDYFKKDQLNWFFEFLTKEIGLDPDRLYVTVFAGDEENDIPKDTDSVEIWKEIFSNHNMETKDVFFGSEEEGYKRGLEGGRIFYYDKSKNWWSRGGSPEEQPVGDPGGPDSEVFFDLGTEHDPAYGEHCHPNCDCGRFLEIGNSVFMEYLKLEDGAFVELDQKNVDFGGGLERIAAAVNDTPDIFEIDAFKDVISRLEGVSGKKYVEGEDKEAFRIIADHFRGAVFMIADGVTPGNTKEGYIVRRLLRRSIQKLDTLGVQEEVLGDLVQRVVDKYKGFYPELERGKEEIKKIISEEEEKFRRTLAKGMKKFEEMSDDDITGEEAFTLFSTFGFPLEVIIELADKKGISVDTEGFRWQMEEHRERSRTAAEGQFKSGLADESNMTIKYHTTAHVLLQALRDVLGEEVLQKGSNINPERIRFDFSFSRKMTDEEKEQVEEIVNEKIGAGLAVTHEDISHEKAKERGAIGAFEDKYGDVVRVYSVGDYSKECCAGPHIENTNEIDGKFRIVKEESVSSGVRRVKAVIE